MIFGKQLEMQKAFKKSREMLGEHVETMRKNDMEIVIRGDYRIDSLSFGIGHSEDSSELVEFLNVAISEITKYQKEELQRIALKYGK